MKSPFSTTRSPGIACGLAVLGPEATIEENARESGAVVEHESLELGANLLLGEAGAEEGAHMLEGGIGDGLRMAHERQLLSVLDRAHALDIAMHRAATLAQIETSSRAALDTAEERNLHIVLDGDDGALSLDGRDRPPNEASQSRPYRVAKRAQRGRFSSNELK